MIIFQKDKLIDIHISNLDHNIFIPEVIERRLFSIRIQKNVVYECINSFQLKEY